MKASVRPAKRQEYVYDRRVRGGALLACTCLICLMVWNSTAQISDASVEFNNSIVWGQSTNGVRPGLLLERPRGKQSAGLPVKEWRVSPAFVGHSTNDVLIWLAPKTAWSIELQTDRGDSVKKTRLGNRFGGTLQVGRGGLQKSGFSLFRVNSTLPYLPGRGFLLSDLFALERAGTYTLKVGFAAMIVKTNQVLPTYFTPVLVHLEVTD